MQRHACLDCSVQSEIKMIFTERRERQAVHLHDDVESRASSIRRDRYIDLAINAGAVRLAVRVNEDHTECMLSLLRTFKTNANDESTVRMVNRSLLAPDGVERAKDAQLTVVVRRGITNE